MFKKEKVKQHIRRTSKGVSIIKGFDRNREKKVKPFVIGALAGAGSVAALGTAFVLGRKNGLNSIARRIPKRISVKVKQPNVVVNVTPPSISVNPNIRIKTGKTVNDINVDIKQPNLNVNTQTVNNIDLDNSLTNVVKSKSKNTNISTSQSVANADAKAVNINVQKPEPKVIGSATKSTKPQTLKVKRNSTAKRKTDIPEKSKVQDPTELKQELKALKESNNLDEKAVDILEDMSNIKASKIHKGKQKVEDLNTNLSKYKDKQSKTLKDNGYNSKDDLIKEIDDLNNLKTSTAKGIEGLKTEIDGINNLKSKYPKFKSSLEKKGSIDSKDFLDNDDFIEDAFRHKIKTKKVDLDFLDPEYSTKLKKGSSISEIDKSLRDNLSEINIKKQEIQINKRLSKARKENELSNLSAKEDSLKKQKQLLEKESLNFESLKEVEVNKKELVKRGFSNIEGVDNKLEGLNKLKQNLDIIDEEAESVWKSINKSNLKKNQSIISKLKGDYTTDGIFVYKRNGRGATSSIEHISPKGKSGQELDYRKLDNSKITESDIKRALEDADPEEAKQILKVIRNTRSSLAKMNAGNISLNNKKIKDAVLKGDLVKEEGRYISVTPKGKTLLENKGKLSKQLNQDILNLQKTGRYSSQIKVLSDFEIDSVNIELLSDKTQDREITYLMSDITPVNRKYKTKLYNLTTISL